MADGQETEDKPLMKLEAQENRSAISDLSFESEPRFRPISTQADQLDASISRTPNNEAVIDRGLRPGSVEAVELAERAKYSRFSESAIRPASYDKSGGNLGETPVDSNETASPTARHDRTVGRNVESPKIPGSQDLEPAKSQRSSVSEPGPPVPKESMATANSIDSARAESVNSVAGESTSQQVSSQPKGVPVREGASSGSDSEGVFFKASVEHHEKNGSAPLSFAGSEQVSNRRPAQEATNRQGRNVGDVAEKVPPSALSKDRGVTGIESTSRPGEVGAEKIGTPATVPEKPSTRSDAAGSIETPVPASKLSRGELATAHSCEQGAAHGKVADLPERGLHPERSESAAKHGEIRSERPPGTVSESPASREQLHGESSSTSSKTQPGDGVGAGSKAERGDDRGAEKGMKADDIKSAGMALWDGKNNPLVSGKGQGPSRGGPFEPRGGREPGAGKNVETGKGKSSKIDPRADMSPSEKSRVDAIIKETDRRIFGDKGEKQQATKGSRGDSKGEVGAKTDSKKDPRGEKSGVPGESKPETRGEPRSEPGITRTSKVPHVSEPSGGKERGPDGKLTVPDSKTPHGQEGELPPNIPMPGIKFGGSDFGIKWPGNKGEKGGKSGPGKSPADKGSRGEKGEGEGVGTSKSDIRNPASRESDSKGSGSVREDAGKDAKIRIEPARVKDARDAIVKLLPEGRENIKIVRDLGSKEPADSRPEVKDPASPRTGDMRVTAVKIASRRESQQGKADVPVVAPVDFSIITNWVDLKGILKTGKSLIPSDTVRTDGAATQPSDTVKKGAKVVPSEQAGKKVADTTGAIKDPGDAFGGKLPDIKMTYAEKDGMSRNFQGGKVGAPESGVGVPEIRPVSPESKIGAPESKAAFPERKVAQPPAGTTGFIPPKGGIASPDATVPTRPGRDVGTQAPLNDQDQARIQGKSESDAQKGKPDRARPAAEAREGRMLLHELVRTNTFRLGVSKVADRGLDGARVVAGDLSLWIPGTSDESSTRTIREILGKFNLATPRRDFTPEITESGSYRVARSNSSQQLAAFASSARMAAIGAQLFGSSQELSAQGDSDESQEAPGAERLLKQDESSSRADEGARQWHIVQDGETPESIAVVHCSDAALGALIREINKPLLQQMYDVYQQEHVYVLPAGVMILLPNERDIDEYRHGSGS